MVNNPIMMKKMMATTFIKANQYSDSPKLLMDRALRVKTIPRNNYSIGLAGLEPQKATAISRQGVAQLNQ
jgi:hypothetical protein